MTKEEFLQAIEQMTVKDLAELVSAIEERFGVSAQVAAPVAVATAAPAATLLPRRSPRWTSSSRTRVSRRSSSSRS